MKQKEKVIVGSNVFFVFLMYVIGIWLCEVIDLACYYLNLPQATIVSRVLVFLLTAVIVVYSRKRIELQPIRFSWLSGCVLVLIFAVGFLKACIPDTAFDTGNYHIVAQQPEFVNHFENEIGAGNIQIWGFRLGDRLFNIFRELLGYRLGQIFSTLVVMLLYLQSVQLLKQWHESLFQNVIENGNRFSSFLVKTIFRPEIAAIAIIAVHDVVLELSSYYVDFLSVPFAMEVLRILTSKKETQTKAEMRCFVILLGIWFAFKMTNVIYILPCLIWYLFKYRKQLSVGIFLQCAVLGILPCSIYLIFNFTCTGNPVYPYYNEIFHSKYFGWYNFKDGRWGPYNLKEKLLWTWNLVFHNEERFSEKRIYYTWGIAMGYVVIVFSAIRCIVYKVRKKKSERIMPAACFFVTVLSMALWVITTGYSRYFLWGNMLLMMMVYSGLLYLVSRKNFVSKFFSCVATVAFLWLPCLEMKDFFKGNDWCGRVVEAGNLKYQIQFIGLDVKRNLTRQFDKYDCFFISYPSNVGKAYVVRNGQQIISTSFYDNIQDESVEAEIAQKVDKILRSRKKVCDIEASDLYYIEGYCARMNENRLQIKNAKRLFNGIENVMVYEVERVDEPNNIVLYGSIGITKKLDDKKIFRTTAITKYNWGYGDEWYILGATAIVNGKEEIVYGQYVPESQTKEFVFDFSKYEEGTEIHIDTYHPNAEKVKLTDANQVCLLNYVWE